MARPSRHVSPDPLSEQWEVTDGEGQRTARSDNNRQVALDRAHQQLADAGGDGGDVSVDEGDDE